MQSRSIFPKPTIYYYNKRRCNNYFSNATQLNELNEYLKNFFGKYPNQNHFTEVRNFQVTKSNYEIESHKILSFFELLT